GFLLRPAFGLQGGILLVASIYVVLGLLLMIVHARERRTRSTRTAIAGALGLVLVAGNILFEGKPVILGSHWFKQEPGRYRLVFNHEGSSSSISVIEKPNGVRELNLNGFSTAADNYMDMQVHRMLSHLPILLHPKPEKLLVVGFGMGSTVWGCCQHGAKRVDVVELLEAEKRTAPFFENINHGVLGDPRLGFIVGDGRNYLLATREKYDVISFNAIHPRYSANLYTVGFYRMCRERMTEDGVICAWMTQNSMTDGEWRMLCRSFVEVFEESSIWFCNPQHFCLIGSIQPQKISFEDWRRRVSKPEVKRDLMDSNLDDPHALLSRYMFGGKRLADYVAGAGINTDDRPRIEFARETRREEGAVVRRMLELVEPDRLELCRLDEPGLPVDTILAHRRAALWLMKGETEDWYPIDRHRYRAEIHFRRGLLLTPENQDLRRQLDFSDDIARMVEGVMKEDAGHAWAFEELGRIRLEQGRFEEAESLLLGSFRRNGSRPVALFNYALL
ncbi:MAG: hypothetical protein ACE5F1_23270, partial [Planctomycetota bacterium]